MPERTVATKARQAGTGFATAMEANLRAMRAKVHIARKELGLDEETYRAVLQRAAGIDSTAEAGPSHFDAILKEFRRLGWKPRTARQPRSDRPQVRMIQSVWKDLGPFVSDPSQAGLRAFVARQTRTPARPAGVSAPEFLDGVAANRVLEGLKAWLARERAKAATATTAEAG